ncbi:MAG: hypothetical protein HQL76_10760 [Magnetococcales bacterium]|nr:hypothetical protein [Magnetococcales bacterium]
MGPSPHKLIQSLDFIFGEVFNITFPVQGKQVNLAFGHVVEINDPKSTTFASAVFFRLPPDFPDTTTPWDFIPKFRVFYQLLLQFRKQTVR